MKSAVEIGPSPREISRGGGIPPVGAKISRREYIAVLAVATVASVIALIHYYLTDGILTNGDAVAHINIARRVFDTRTPGLTQLGTVWLPLPHVLTIPFVVNDWLWRTGIGGAIPSMLAYLAGVAGMFRLGRRLFPARKWAAWLAAGVYGMNPNLLYMQATPMTEALSLALFVWAAVFLVEFFDAARHELTWRATRPLWWCGVMLSGEMLTRYDGWFTSGVAGVSLFVFIVWHAWRGWPARASRVGVVAAFALVLSIVPAAWLGYNYKLYGNPLEFANGPYSAKGIAARTTKPTDPPYPGKNSPAVAAEYFVKSAKLNLAGYNLQGEYRREFRRTWQEDAWVLLALAGTAVLLVRRRFGVLALFWTPLPFYALSVAYSAVPIFLPVWWPFSYYNVRYGLQLLPLAAVCATALVVGASKRVWSEIPLATVGTFVAVAYVGSWMAGPICWQEGFVNSRQRRALENQLIVEFHKMPATASILMSTGEHVGALERGDVPIRRTVNENNWNDWRAAMLHPERVAEYAVSFDHDDVAQTMERTKTFEAIRTIDVPGQNPATVWRRLPDALSQR